MTGKRSRVVRWWCTLEFPTRGARMLERVTRRSSGDCAFKDKGEGEDGGGVDVTARPLLLLLLLSLSPPLLLLLWSSSNTKNVSPETTSVTTPSNCFNNDDGFTPPIPIPTPVRPGVTWAALADDDDWRLLGL